MTCVGPPPADVRLQVDNLDRTGLLLVDMVDIFRWFVGRVLKLKLNFFILSALSWVSIRGALTEARLVGGP